MVNLKTNLSLLPNDGYTFSFQSDLYVPLDTFFAKVGIALPSPNGKFDTMIQNTVQDVCKFYRNNNGNMFLRLFFNGKFTEKSFPSSCPIAPGHYFMEGFEFDDKFLTIRGVQTKFLVLIDLCQKSSGGSDKLSCFVNIKFYGEVKDRKKWEKEMEQNRSDKT